MHIDSYQFGNIVIDGVNYNKDVIILGDTVQANWWRKRGHLLSAEDLQPVIAAKPSVLIVGCGASGLMKVSDEVRQALLEEDIQLEAVDTAKAVERFNELSKTDVNIAAALHLAC
ncbi:MAG: Mth938-like domain-containing protein [Planctomycetes bacterium]|nr:Mth938-like domain-containing protein [Planctomycetota bacterium]MCH8118241.1 Mth938-like domain-containing protein [Planctomycetota bacterium]